MTKKDYELIASCLKWVFDNKTIFENEENLVITMAKRLSNRLAEKNPRFNREKFLTACGVEVENVCASGHKQDEDGRCKCTNKDSR